MKPDDFEQKLQRQPLRQVPAEWRAEILAAARRNTVAQVRNAGTAPLPNRTWLSTLNSQLSTIFWPHPRAWAGLAAVWVFIFVLNFPMRDRAPALAEKVAPPSPETVVELKQQQRMLAELMGLNQTREAEAPKFLPLPRSERVEISAV